MYFGFRDITVSYKKKNVLDRVSLSVPEGRITTLIGQNGCGKSTLLKTVSRTVTPQTGEVIYRDAPMKTFKRKVFAQKVAYLAQVHTSPPDIDVRTLVSYGRYPHMKPYRGMTADDARIIDETITVTGLSALSHRALSTLSGGERQRAWIAMTVCQQPEILILDEPTTYLDISYQIEVLELIKELNQKMNMTILMVLHDLNLAARYSDHLAIIKNGGVFAEGTPTDILTEENLRTVFRISSHVTADPVHGCPYFIPDVII